MQEGRQTLHQDQNTDGQNGPEGKDYGQHNATEPTLLLQTDGQHHIPKDLSQF